MESPKLEQQSSQEIPPHYQEAFKALANELVFNDDLDMEISQKTVPIIAEGIRKEFLELGKEHQKIMNKSFDLAFQDAAGNVTQLTEFKREEKEQGYLFADKGDEETDLDFATRVAEGYRAVRYLDSAHSYNSWGITPKLAKKENAELPNGLFEINQNCFGVTQTLAGYYERSGLTFDMGITTDHPFVVLYLEDGVYLADNGGIKKATGVLEDKGTYKIYRPGEEDDIEHTMLMVHDFDRAQIYELLENMEVLRQLLLEKDNTHIPGTMKSGQILAEAHKETLQKIDWKDLQSKLFPDIEASFQENKEAWKKEVEHIQKMRGVWHVEHIISDASLEALKKTTYAELPYEEAQSKIFTEIQGYEDELIAFMENDAVLLETLPENVQIYFTSIKEEILKEEDAQYVEQAMQKIILKLQKIKFVDNSEKDDTVSVDQ